MTARRPLLTWFAAVGLIAVIAAAAAYALMVWRTRVRLQPPPVELPPRPTGLEMDYGWAVKTLDGERIEMAEFRGRPLFLNLWATWCPPCAAEIPHIDALYRRMEGRGVTFLAVAVDSTEPVRRFVAARDLAVPVYVADGPLPAAIRPTDFPATYVVSAGGEVVFRHTGIARWDDASVVEFLEALAQEPERR